MELVGVTLAAKELHLSRNRVRQLIKAGRLPAQKIGREYAITREDLEKFKTIDRPVGRPPNEDQAETGSKTPSDGGVESAPKARIKQP
jgi:excisionase family DNA binding protein